MKTPSLIKDYRRLSDNNLDFRAEAISNSLTDNPNFETTVPTIADFDQVRTAFTTAMQNISTGDRLAIARKNQARGALLTIMKQLAMNIESLAPGDRAKLMSSGFRLAGDGESSTPLEAPKNFTITDGLNAGEIRLSVQGMANAVSYMHEYAEEPLTSESRWISKVSSVREHTFTGLRSGMRVYARIAVIGRKGQEVYSNTLSRIVQ